MMYYKMIGDRQVFSDCRTIQTNDGVWISNPSEEQILAAGWQVYIPPEPPAPTPQTQPDIDAMMEAVRKMLDASVEELTDEEALEVAALFPTWASKIGEQVDQGQRLWYDGKLYKVVQHHTVSEEWTPDTTPALFTEVSIEEWPLWVQPQGAHDAYNTGDQVTHNETHWVSTMDGNVYEPGVYGWEARP